MSVDIATYVHDLAVAAKAASASLATASDEQRQEAVRAMAAALRNGVDSIVAANELDMSAARDAGTSAGLLDRLLLTPERVEGMAAGLEKLAELPDPVGRVLDHRVLASGVHLTRASVPLGLVAMVYEARPNVTADAAGICIRTGNACILRGGSLAYHSCAMIAELLADALEAKGFPREAVSMIESTDREATGELMKLRGVVDVLIPRGGAGLIQRCVRESLVPVIETGTGNCHIYVHESADFDKALNIIVNAKTQRVGVCNAAESLLVDRAVADAFLPAVVAVLHDHGVLIHGDEATCAACADAGFVEGDDYVAATEEDWGREYLALEMSVKVVANEDEAIAHINRYGTMHSEAIVAEDTDACERFLDAVDASAVYANASTRFTDGGEFGLGAEIGISTQKLHARGPFAAEALTTYKYKLRGTGQVRPKAPAQTKTTTKVPVPFVVVLELSLEGVAIGSEGLHGRDGAVEELGELPAEHLSALRNDVARAAGGKALVLELLLERLGRKVHNTLARAHDDGGSDQAGELVAGEQDLLHLQLGLGQRGVEIGRVRLDGANEIGRGALALEDLGRIDGVVHGVILMLLPIQVVQQADDAPELLVLGVELARKVAHSALDRLAMGDVERVFVVLVKQFKRAVAGDSGGKRLCHRRLLVLVGNDKNEYY